MSDNHAPAPATAAEQLARMGIHIDPRAAFSALELPEPQYGEDVVGELTDDEVAVFVELYEANREQDTRGRDATGAQFMKLGEAIRSGATPEALMSGANEFFASEADAHDFFAIGQKVAMLHSKLHWMLGERFGLHHWRLGVRQGARVVKLASGRRY